MNVVIKFTSSVEKCYQGTSFWVTTPREPFNSEVSALLKGPNFWNLFWLQQISKNDGIGFKMMWMVEQRTISLGLTNGTDDIDSILKKIP